MNANGRRVRQFNNGFRHLAKICGSSIRGGRPIYSGRTSLTVAESIQRERDSARREMQRKVTKK